MQNVNIANIAGGALVERADIEIQRVYNNILDLNTDAKKKRKVVITLEFKPDEERDITDVSFNVKSVIAPTRPIVTRVAIEKDGNHVVAEELRKGAMQGQTQIDYDTGEVTEPIVISKVVNIK